MLKLMLQYFGHLMWRADSLEKTLMLGKIEGGRRRGQQTMRWLDGITDSMDMSLIKLSIQFSCSAVSYSLQPHGLQHARPPCPSPTPRVYSNSCPLSQWCHPTISSSVVPFSHLQSFPASGSFQMSQLFTSSGQSIVVSASASVRPMNTQDWSPLGMDWLDLLAVQGTLKSLLQHHSSKASILWCSAFFTVQLISIHDHWKNHSLD